MSAKINGKIALVGALVGAGLLWMLHKKKSAAGIGATKRERRRIWREIEDAQKAGVDLSDPNGWENNKGKLDHIMLVNEAEPSRGKSDKPIHQRYFNQLRRAYKSIAGTNLPYEESVVRNENDDVILIYRDYHLSELPRTAANWMLDQYTNEADTKRAAYFSTIAEIALGTKFVWDSKGVHRGVCELLFGRSAPEERKKRISYLASPEKGGIYPEQLAHQAWEADQTGRYDTQDILDGILEALRTCNSVGEAQKICADAYLKWHQIEEPLLYQDVPF